MDERADFIRKFWHQRSKIEHPQIATHFREDDSIKFDFELVRRFCNPKTRILDLGAGTCTLDRLLAPFVKEIVAVDFIREFFDKQQLPPNIKTVVSDIKDFESIKEFDIVLLFGVLNYFFDDHELISFYKKINNFLSKKGIFIIKHQVGKYETVLIDKLSEEINSHYMAIYRQLDLEVSLLKSIFKKVEIVDIYPDYLNRWKNTHFYAFIVRRS